MSAAGESCAAPHHHRSLSSSSRDASSVNVSSIAPSSRREPCPRCSDLRLEGLALRAQLRDQQALSATREAEWAGAFEALMRELVTVREVNRNLAFAHVTEQRKDEGEPVTSDGDEATRALEVQQFSETLQRLELALASAEELASLAQRRAESAECVAQRPIVPVGLEPPATRIPDPIVSDRRVDPSRNHVMAALEQAIVCSEDTWLAPSTARQPAVMDTTRSPRSSSREQRLQDALSRLRHFKQRGHVHSSSADTRTAS
jgi:RNase P subunit RPR2